MATTESHSGSDGRPVPTPLMIFRPVSREQRLKTLLKPARPLTKLPRR